VDFPTPDEPSRAIVDEMCLERVDACAGERRDGNDVDPWRRGVRGGDPVTDVFYKIRFRQHHDRQCATLPRDGEVALEATLVDVVGHRGHDEDAIDVGRDDLRHRLLARCASNECRLSRKDGADACRVVVLGYPEHDPVAGGGSVDGVCVVEMGSEDCVSFAEAAGDDDAIAVNGRDASGHVGRRGGCRERLGERGVPA